VREANEQGVLLSVLVVSRTPHLMVGMLLSLNQAYGGASGDLEVLCSWNGDDFDTQSLLSACRFKLHLITQRPYSFPRNVNSLAAASRGRYLLLLNDDVLLDPLTINVALAFHEHTARAGILGSVLRRRDGAIAHIGISFNQDGHPCHLMEGVRLAKLGWLAQSYRVPAVTGACMLIMRSDFELLGLDTTYDVYGEDVDLCLRMRRHLHKEVWCCVGLTGIHEASTTRKIVGTHNPNTKDSGKIICAYQSFIGSCQKSDLLLELLLAQMEVSVLRETTLGLQSLVPSQQTLLNISMSPATTVDLADASDADDQLNRDEFHITTRLRHERHGEIQDRVVVATGDVSELRVLSLQIYQVLSNPQIAVSDAPSSLLDILYDHWISLVDMQPLPVDL
jgi:hypothetical protein